MRWLDRILCRFGRCRRCNPIQDERGLGGACVACGRIHGWMWWGEIDVALGFVRAFAVPGLPPTHVAELPRARIHRGEILTRHSTPLE